MNKFSFITIWLLYSLSSCTPSIETAENTDGYPNIFPDYTDIAIPVNIAPLNFGLQDEGDKMVVHFIHDKQVALKCKGRRTISIPLKAWRRMLRDVSGSDLQVQVYVRQSGKWRAFQPFPIHVVNDSIDPYIVYRLIEPGYELWDQMGLFQRCLSTFDESSIIVNRLTQMNCVNCHSFHDYNPAGMMFHARGGNYAGTFLYADGKMQRVNTKTKHAESAGTYPIWHPSGDYIAFSSNVTRQTFHALPGKKIEVYDLESDLVVWDVKRNAMLRDARFTTKDEWETFPAWSPDGKWLYYCFAEKKNMPFESRQLRYGLCRVDFDVVTGRFGAQIDTLFHPETSGFSISFPRLSPDGRYLLYTASAYATFPIWHREANLEMIDLSDGSVVDIHSANSDQADSYHAWSSNGRWILFSSRRIDGLYTRLFIAHFDAEGRISKPFLLPQKNPNHNTRLLKSYNVPEFVKGKVELSPYDISRTLSEKTIDLNETIY